MVSEGYPRLLMMLGIVLGSLLYRVPGIFCFLCGWNRLVPVCRLLGGVPVKDMVGFPKGMWGCRLELVPGEVLLVPGSPVWGRLGMCWSAGF